MFVSLFSLLILVRVANETEASSRTWLSHMDSGDTSRLRRFDADGLHDWWCEQKVVCFNVECGEVRIHAKKKCTGRSMDVEFVDYSTILLARTLRVCTEMYTIIAREIPVVLMLHSSKQSSSFSTSMLETAFATAVLIRCSSWRGEEQIQSLF